MGRAEVQRCLIFFFGFNFFRYHSFRQLMRLFYHKPDEFQ